MESALRLLAYRPRSEQELRERLARKGFEPAVVDRTLDRLRELGYLNDDAFARLWTETEQAFRPKSRWLLTAELRRRGVAQHTAEEATAGLSDEEAAYQAAQRRLRALHGLEYQRFREKLGGFLSRRGFSYEIARRTVDRCWAEREEAPAKEADLE
jgi:regulatory protein